MANFAFDQAEGLRRLLGRKMGTDPISPAGKMGTDPISPAGKMGSVPILGAAPGLAADKSPIIQVGTTPDSIKTAYALIKRLAQEEGWRRFGILVTGAVSPSEAKLVYDNMATAATKYLSVQLYAVAAAGPRPTARRGAHPKLAG